MSKNRKIIEYKILNESGNESLDYHSDTIKKLEDNVNEYLNKKDEIWEPYGNVSAACFSDYNDSINNYFYQTIVRYLD